MAEDYRKEAAIELACRHAVTSRRVAALEPMPVGPTLVAALAALRGEPVDAATAVRIDALWAKVEAWAAAQRLLATHDAVTGIGGYLPGVDPLEQVELVAQDIAATNRVTFAAATRQVDLALAVGEELGACWEALDRGQLSLAHLRALRNATAHCPPRLVAAVDARAVPLAIERGWTPSRLTAEARKIILRLDPEGATERAKAAKARGDVQYRPDVDDTAALVAEGDAVALRRVFDTLNARAETMRREGDSRPVGLRRLAALTDAILDPSPAAASAQAIVHLDLTTYLGLTQTPGELVGHGPITADAARRIAADAMLRRLVTDPLTGRGIDLGRRSYRPSAALHRFVAARDKICQFFGCSQPAVACQADHDCAYSAGGRTDAANLQLLCLRHHAMKTAEHWSVVASTDTTRTWRSPLGFVHTVRLDDYDVTPPEPPDDLPPDLGDAHPVAGADPPDDAPLPEPPIITLEDYFTYSDDLERQLIANAITGYDRFYAAAH